MSRGGGAPTRPFSERQLEDASEHLEYELQQIAHGTHRTVRIRQDHFFGLVVPEDLHLARANLEAFLVHIRVVDEILGSKAPRPTDVVATDFDPSYQPKHALSLGQQSDINGRIAHLTTRRHDDSFEWDRSELTERVFKQFGVFLDGLSQRHADRAAWISVAFEDAQKLVVLHKAGWPDPRHG
ncbi:MAG: hypothetical protein U0W40_15565 [Acidimicrobiia bacterium]